ncbi:MAG: hypothetical protein P4L84_17060 [Isosphaeraceae bacterium]|nr:hypothetical protein [Isosphaeraceae bacterium]
MEILEARQLLAYTFTLVGTTATATGDSQSDTLTIGAQNGLLFHSVNGSAADFTWGSATGTTTLPAGPTSTVNIQQGTGAEAVVLVSSSAAGASLGGTVFNLLGGGPADTLKVDDSADSTPGSAYTVQSGSVVGPGIQANFGTPPLGGGITLLGGTGGDAIAVDSSGAGQPVDVVSNGADTVTVGAGAVSNAINGPVAVSGTTGATRLTVNDSRDDAGRAVTLVGNSVGTSTLGGLGPATITATTAGLKSYTVLGGLGNDSLSVDLSTANPVPSGGLTDNGGGGTNTLNVNAGGRAANVATPGVVTLAGVGPLSYASVQAVNVVNAADPPLSPLPKTIKATQGSSLNQVDVGSFTDADPNGQPGNFSAQINWGDGTPSTIGTVVKDPVSGFDVLGSHTYAAAGTFSVAVSVADNGNTAKTTVAGVPISVTDPGGASTTVNSTANVTAQPFRLVVTTTADLVNGVPAEGSLRANILAANAHPGADTIIFDIVPQAGVEDIRLNAPLPAITDPVTLDATTQPGYQGQPIVVVDGSSTTGDGLTFDVGNSAVRGLVISGFSGAGINLASGGGDLIQNDYIGTGASGQNALGNSVGVLVGGGAGTTIGGTAAGAGNTISGNLTAGVYVSGPAASGTAIVGNRIGTNPAGTAPVVRSGVTDPLQALQNTGVVVVNSGGNSIHGNLVSGNYVGVMLSGNGSGGANVVDGNLIGTDASGAVALGNIVGVYINGSSGNLIGGTNQGAGNTVSGNSSVGVEILGSAATGNLVEGNLIGPAADGLSVLRNSNGTFAQPTGVFIQGASGNLIGGASAGAGDTITGNESAGVFILSRNGTASGNVVQGDFIGLGPGGVAGPGNAGYGVLFYNAPNNQVIRTGSSATQFGRNGLANFTVFNGALPATSSSLVAPAVGKTKARTPAHQPAKHHPSGPVGHQRKGRAIR